VQISPSQRLIIVSDLHLTDWFDEVQADFLQTLFRSADQIILNGDFWDGLMIPFEKFVTSEWKKQLFPLLKQKQALYLYGNHDDKEFCDERVALFSTRQAKQQQLAFGEYTLQVEHGEEFYPFHEKMPFLPQAKLLHYVIVWIERLVQVTLGLHFLQQHFYHRLSTDMAAAAKPTLGSKTILVCGHTHNPEINLPEQYINGGFTKHGISQFIEIYQNTLTIYEVNYRRQPNQREVLAEWKLVDNTGLEPVTSRM
jgi:predicted phosphodiesterase